MALVLQNWREMLRLLLLFCALVSFSSCLAVSRTTVAAKQRMKRGAIREAHVRLVHADEAAVIRQRYNEEERRAKAASLATARQLDPTPPPVLAVEPIRQPLRHRN